MKPFFYLKYTLSAKDPVYVKVQASDVRDRVGLCDPDADGELLHPVDNALVASGLEDWEEVSAPILNPILEAAKNASDFESFNLALNDISKNMDNKAFAEQLANLCFKARALGDVTDA